MGDVYICGIVDLFRARTATHDQVAQMRLLAAGAADIPSSPALLQRAGVIDAISAGSENRQTHAVGKYRARQVPWIALVERGSMTDEAIVRLPLQKRLGTLLLAQRIKHGS